MKPLRSGADGEDVLLDGKYRLGRLLGEGGMGRVYEGENVRIGRRVAIKVLHGSIAAQPEFVQRFEREALASARIGSNHVVDVLDLGDLPSRERYMVMEFLDGESLAARLESCGKMTPHEVAPIALQLLEGLIAIHGAGILHRDLKPANIFLARTPQGDFVKILDLGVCRFHELLAEEKREVDAIRETESGVTSKYGLLGTPEYMSPEQVLRLDVDERSDIHQVGVVLHRAVTGKLPFVTKPLLSLLERITADDRVVELDADVEPTFAAIVKKAMARHPKDRFASAAELHAAIHEWALRVDSVNRLLADYLMQPAPKSIKTPPAFDPPRHTLPARISQVTARSSEPDVDAAPTVRSDRPMPEKVDRAAPIAPPPYDITAIVVLVLMFVVAAALCALLATR